jgi:ABC-type Fe3+/spermidine/putrescine transport system ATPase subunit
MTASTILELHEVRKRYGGNVALDGVSISVDSGEFVAVVGPSGCGKTTLLKLIAGFEEPDSGSIEIDGRDARDVAPSERPTRMVFQDLALFPHMTVTQNIGFPLRLRTVPKASLRERVEEVAELMQLPPGCLHRYPAQLSGGEQQRVALARALISRPRLLLLDEPLSALDAPLAKTLRVEIKRLHRTLGMTCLHVTHNLEEAMMLADRICVLHGGRIAQIGTPEDIYCRPSCAYVARLFGDTNLLAIELSEVAPDHVAYRSAEITDIEYCLPRDVVTDGIREGPAYLMVRPEQLRNAATAGTALPCRLAVRVVEEFKRGAVTQYRAETPSGTPVVFDVPSRPAVSLRVGDTLELRFERQDAFVLPREAE